MLRFGLHMYMYMYMYMPMCEYGYGNGTMGRTAGAAEVRVHQHPHRELHALPLLVERDGDALRPALCRVGIGWVGLVVRGWASVGMTA